MDNRRSFLSPGVARLLLVLVGIFAGCLIAEKIARLAAPYPMSYPWMDQINGVIAPLPNVHGRHFVPGLYDTTFSFNSQRFRGQQIYTREPGAKVLRIVALGASFTFGSGVNDVDAYPSQLQSILRERAQREGWKQTVEVINAGVAGTVAAEQALWYENWVKDFHPDVVVLGVGCAADHLTGLFESDGNGTVTPRAGGDLRAANSETSAVRGLVHRVPGFTLLGEHSELFNLFRLAEGEKLRHKADAALGADAAVSDPDDVLDKELRFETGEVRWLKNRVEQSGARFAVVVMPCRENIYASQSRFAPRIRKEYPIVVNALRETATAEGIRFTELSSVFMEKAKGEQPLYYDGKYETHPTPAGYRAIAEGVAGFLVEQKVIPPERTSGFYP